MGIADQIRRAATRQNLSIYRIAKDCGLDQSGLNKSPLQNALESLKLRFALDIFALQFAGNGPQVTESLQKMKPKSTDSQRSLFSCPLEKILDPDHPLVILSSKIDWSQFDDLVDECYSEEGRQAAQHA